MQSWVNSLIAGGSHQPRKYSHLVEQLPAESQLVCVDGWDGIDGACGAVFWQESKTEQKFTRIMKLLDYFAQFGGKTCVRIE